MSLLLEPFFTAQTICNGDTPAALTSSSTAGTGSVPPLRTNGKQMLAAKCRYPSANAATYQPPGFNKYNKP
jgi:hypothetical protein